MSFAYDLERVSKPRLEDRLLLVETIFVQRVVEGMPFPAPPRSARDAEKVVIDMVAKAFKDWFAPQRAVFIDAWTKQERPLAPSVEEFYGVFLEKVALRKGKYVATEEDVWDAPHDRLDQVLDAGAETFRCALQQQEGWIAQYRQLSGDTTDGRNRRQDYLRLANLARGFLGIRQTTERERTELMYAGLQSKEGAIIPEEALSKRITGHGAEGLLSAFEIGQNYRYVYEDEVQRLVMEGEARQAFARVVQETLRIFEPNVLIGPHIADNVRRYANFSIQLEEELRNAQLTRAEAASVDACKAADARLEEIQRRRSGAKESLAKARILLRVYEEAKRLSLVKPEEEGRVIRLTEIAKRLEL